LPSCGTAVLRALFDRARARHLRSARPLHPYRTPTTATAPRRSSTTCSRASRSTTTPRSRRSSSPPAASLACRTSEYTCAAARVEAVQLEGGPHGCLVRLTRLIRFHPLHFHSLPQVRTLLWRRLPRTCPPPLDAGAGGQGRARGLSGALSRERGVIDFLSDADVYRVQLSIIVVGSDSARPAPRRLTRGPGAEAPGYGLNETRTTSIL
jgi:putative component of membrane protein insertase Oxa1/YidC/SpoIIIJ protein YidD